MKARKKVGIGRPDLLILMLKAFHCEYCTRLRAAVHDRHYGRYNRDRFQIGSFRLGWCLSRIAASGGTGPKTLNGDSAP